MADETPQLNDKQLPWYRGLSKYQWWVLLIASMGWMFDTMDQQFFNLGRGQAMLEVLGVDPVVPGLEALGEHAKASYTEAELERLVDQSVITEEQKERAIIDSLGKRREKVTRKTLAKAVGQDDPALVERYKELAKSFETAEGKQLSDFEGESFTRESIQPLIDAKLITDKNADQLLRGKESISREQLTLFIGREVAASKASSAGGESTSIFVFGWAIGGLFFGWVGDAIGRAKTMAITILMYAIFTGLNGLAQTELQFNILRFLTALGVGGEFAAGAALVAESMPDRSRPAALGALQALSAIGNMMGALLAYFILPTLGWRWLFAVGAVPGLVAVIVFLKLKEPEKWREARQKWLAEKAAGTTTKSASYVGLFEDPRWRKRAIIGLLLGVVGVGGLWGVGFFTPELNRLIAKDNNMSEEKAEQFVSIAFFLQQFGAFLGISAYTMISLKMGRRPAFGIFFILAFLIVSYTFLKADSIGEAYFLAPLIGFVTLGPFGGYAIYFPELFPTRLRSTGVGFCYNVGRFLAAPVSTFKGWIKDLFMLGSISLPWLASAQGDATLAIRYGSFIMIFIYIFGLFVLLFAPETKDQPLPED